MAKQFWRNWQSEIRFGLLVVGVSLLWMVGENILLTVYQQPQWGTITGTLALAIPLVGYWMMLDTIRTPGQKLDWKQAMRSGAVMALTIAIIGAIVVYLYILLVPQPVDLYIEYLRFAYQTRGLSGDEVETLLATSRRLFAPEMQALSTAVGALLSGLILTPAITLIFRFRKKSYERGPG